MQIHNVPLTAINAGNRIRKNSGDLDALAASIKSLGLLSPVVINEDKILLAGFRRMEACRRLGWTEIPATVICTTDEEHRLLVEITENEQRKSFSREELINAGIELERIEKVKAEQRIISSQNNNAGRAAKENFPGQAKKGQTRDIVAARLGMSGKQYEREKYIVEHRDELDPDEFDRWNNREISTNKAYTSINKLLNPPQEVVRKVVEKVEVYPADYKNLVERSSAADSELEELRRELDKMKASLAEKDNTIADMKKKMEPSSAVEEVIASRSLLKASEEFVKLYLAPIQYDKVIPRNQQDTICCRQIMEACELLTGAVADIMRRFEAPKIIEYAHDLKEEIVQSY